MKLRMEKEDQKRKKKKHDEFVRSVGSKKIEP